MTLQRPAAQLGGDQSWRRSADQSYWDTLISEVEVVPRRTAVTGRSAPRPQSAVEGTDLGQRLDGWPEKMQSKNNYRRGSQVLSPGSKPNEQVAKPWPPPPRARVRPQSATEGSRQMNEWLHELERMQNGGYFGGSPSVNPEVEHCRTGHPPRPQSATEGHSQNLDRWLQELERMEDGSYFGNSKRVQTECRQAPFHDRTSSMPALHREPVGPRLLHCHRGLSPSSSLCGWDEGLSSDFPSLCDSSLGSQESLGGGLSSDPEHRGSWERASIKQAPGREHAELSTLTPVRVGWLPVRKRAPMRNALVPRQTQTGLPENSANQVILKLPITPTFVKVPVKDNDLRFSGVCSIRHDNAVAAYCQCQQAERRRGVASPSNTVFELFSQHTDAGAEKVERSQSSVHVVDPGTRWLPDQRPARESPITQQVAGKQSSTSAQSETRPLGWQALRRTWAKRTWLSPLRGGGPPQSKDSLPGPGAEKEPVGTTSDTQQPSARRVTPCGTKLTPQSTDNPEPCWRSSLRRTNSFQTALTRTIKPAVQQTPTHAKVTPSGSCPTQPSDTGVGEGSAGAAPTGTTITLKTARQAFSSITIASKKVSRTASLPGSRSTSPQIHYTTPPRVSTSSRSVTHQDQVHHPTSADPNSTCANLSRMSTGMDSETVNQTKGWQSPVLPGDSDRPTDPVVSRRKVTIIKVTENRHSYSPGQQGGGGSEGNSSSRPSENRHSYSPGQQGGGSSEGNSSSRPSENRHSYSPGQQGGGGSEGNSSSRPSENRHSYCDGVMTKNSLRQQGTRNSEEPPHGASTSTVFSSGHLEPSTDSKDWPNHGPNRGPNRSTSAAPVTSWESAGSRAGAGRPMHKSTLTLFINQPSASPKDVSAETKRETGEGGERRARPRRPISCYANMFEHTEPTKWSLGPDAVSAEPSSSAAQHRSLGAVTSPPASATPRRWSLGLPRHMPETCIDPVAISKDAGAGNSSTARLLSSGSSVRTGATGRGCGTGRPGEDQSSGEDAGGAGRTPDSALSPDEEGFRSRQPQPPAVTLIKPQDPISQQHSPETILALNAAAIIANIKLQRQLSQTKTLSQNGLSNARKSPQGNTLVNDAGGLVTVEAHDRTTKPEKRSRTSQPNPDHVVFVPLDPNSDCDTSTDNILSPREALERSRPDFIRRSQGRVRDMERRAEERRAEERRAEERRAEERSERLFSEQLSDNLFRPRDRAITGKTIYHGTRLKQKKQAEEAKRREIQLINKRRADLFKKKLLDQILQRGSD